MKNFYHVCNDYSLEKFSEKDTTPTRKGHNLVKTTLNGKPVTLWRTVEDKELVYLSTDAELEIGDLYL